jgi:hypothetical protein
MDIEPQSASQEKLPNHDLASVLLLLLIICVFFSPILFGGKTLFGRDITVLAWPMKYFTFKSYHAGHFPLWNPEIYSGMPFLAVMWGALYPLNLIFLLNNFTTAFNLFYVLHYALLAISVYALMRYWKLSAGAALCSSATALLSGYFLSLHAAVSLFYSAVWFPSVFLFYHRYLTEKKSGSLLAMVACLSCEILGGCPEFCILTVVILFLWSPDFANQGVREVLRRGTVLCAAVLLALGITAPQLLPTYSLVSQSGRTGGMAFEAHARWSVSPDDLSTLLLPVNFSGFMEAVPPPEFSLIQSLYMGLFAFYFLCAGTLFSRQKETRFWVCIFFLGIFFALGKYNPLYRLSFEYLPLINFFRYPEKFYFLSAFSQVFLVGFGVDALIKSLSARDSKSALFFCLALVLVVALAVFTPPDRDSGTSIACLVVFIFSCYGFSLGKWNALALKSILLALLLIDLSIKNHMLIPLIDKSFYETPPPAAIRLKQDKDLFRAFVGDLAGSSGQTAPPNLLARQLKIKDVLYPALGTIYGINYADGMRGWGMETQDQWWWASIFDRSDMDKKIRILARGNVKYWIDTEHETVTSTDMPTLEPGNVITLLDALPRAFIVQKARLSEPLKLLNAYYERSFDPLEEVLVSEPECAQTSPVGGSSASVDSLRHTPNQVVIRTRQNGDGFLVLLDSWFPGWTATVDGKPARICRANHFYRSVKTGPGTHTVEFSFEPSGFRTGLLISGATFCTLTAIMLAGLRKRATS